VTVLFLEILQTDQTLLLHLIVVKRYQLLLHQNCAFSIMW